MELDILEALAAGGAEVDLAELRERTGCAPATLTRQLRRLCQSGHILKIRHGVYTVGPRLEALGFQVMHRGGGCYLPLLQNLVRRTGLNAELYLLAGNGPVLLRWEGGRSEFRVRMDPGHAVSSPGHSACAFFLAQAPEADRAWSCERSQVDPDWLRRAKDRDPIFEQGQVRPELARLCLPLPQGPYLLGISGLMSEWPDDVKRITDQAVEEIQRLHSR